MEDRRAGAARRAFAGDRRMSGLRELAAGPLEGRPFQRDDWPEILALHQTPDAARWLLAPGDAPDAGRARRIAEAFAEGWLAVGSGPYLWRRRGRVVGYGGLLRRSAAALRRSGLEEACSDETELTIALTPSVWRRGFGSAIARAALAADGPQPGEEGSVLARARQGDAAAAAFLAALGFEPAGESRWRGLGVALWRWRPESAATRATTRTAP